MQQNCQKAAKDMIIKVLQENGLIAIPELPKPPTLIALESANASVAGAEDSLASVGVVLESAKAALKVAKSDKTDPEEMLGIINRIISDTKAAQIAAQAAVDQAKQAVVDAEIIAK